MAHRVVVTGWGVVSSIGHTAASYWSNLSRGVSGIANATIIPTDQLAHKVVADNKRRSLRFHRTSLGAAGALELVATLMAVKEGIVPPTINYFGPDPACDLDYVPNEARPLRIEAALSNSFAFGGLNAVLAVRHVS